MGRITVKIRIVGRVQGVSFRAFVAQSARMHTVDGWVRNSDDGSVEALLQGEEDDVSAVIEEARIGPPSAHVLKMEKRHLESHPTQSGFEIIPSG